MFVGKAKIILQLYELIFPDFLLKVLCHEKVFENIF